MDRSMLQSRRAGRLFDAVRMKKVDRVESLLELGEDVFEHIGTRRTKDQEFTYTLNPMTLVAMTDDVGLLNRLLRRPIDWSISSIDSYVQAMCVADKFGSRGVLGVMQTHLCCSMMLEYAITMDEFVMVDLMCTHGFDVNASMSTTESALAFAVGLRFQRYGDYTYQSDTRHAEVIHMLLNHGAECNVRIATEWGYETLLRQLLWYGSDVLDITEHFIRRGADLKTVTFSSHGGVSESAMEFACSVRQLEVVQMLRKRGVDIHEVRKSSGHTAMARAVLGDAHQVVEYLIEQWADCKVALRVAYEVQQEVFLLHGADEDYEDTGMIHLIQSSVLARIRRRQAARLIRVYMLAYAKRRANERRVDNMLRALVLRGDPVFYPSCSGYDMAVMGRIADFQELMHWVKVPPGRSLVN